MILGVINIVIQVIALLFGIIAVGAAALAIIRKPRYVQFVMLWALCGMCFALYGALGLSLRYFDISKDVASKLDRYSPALLGVALGISLSFWVFESMQKSTQSIESKPHAK